MPSSLRAATIATGCALLVGAVTGCETSSFSSSCSGDGCSIEISGNDFHDFPRPYDADHGVDSADRIRLVSASSGGEAVIQAGGVEHTCTQGGSFRVVDTEITCETVGDNSVELSTTRS